MAYIDNSIQPLRHIGRQRWAHSGLGPYLNAQAVVTGTFLTTPTEAEVNSGTQTIIITLSRAKWIASGSFNAVRQAIINQLIVSSQTEPLGLATQIASLTVGSVVRSSDTVVTVTLTATPEYKLSADETWKFVVPPTALHRRGGRIEAKAAATVTVINSTAAAPTCALTGTMIAGGVIESEIVTGGMTLICTLTGGTFIATAGFDAVRQAIIDGITAAESEAAGWNVEVRDKAAVTTVVRTSNTIVTFTAPATAGYVVTSDEVLTITIPSAAIALYSGDVAGDVTVTITANS